MAKEKTKIYEIMDYEVWEEKYKPKKSPEKHSPYNNTLIEYYREHWDYLKKQNIRNIWTLVSGEDDSLIILPGSHVVNRLGYFVTEKQWEHENLEVRF